MINKQKFFFFFKHLNIRFLYSFFSLFVTTICCYIYSDPLLYLFIKPFLLEMYTNRFIFTNLMEIFLTYIKFSIILGFIFSIPIFILQCWLFFIPGLYKWERKKLTLSLVISFIFFCLGWFIAYFGILPSIGNFFLKFDNNNLFFPLHFEAKINDYLFFMLFIMVNIILCFQVPPLIIILTLFNIINYKILISKKKFFYFIFLILATVLSSPELINQLIMVCILIILYEFSIFCLYLLKYINL